MKMRLKYILLAVGIVLIGLLFISSLFVPGQPAEKLHFFEYAILAGLVYRSLTLKNAKHLYFRTFLIAFCISLGDECLQYFYPGRVFDFLDVLHNTVGSLFGLSYRILAEKGGLPKNFLTRKD